MENLKKKYPKIAEAIVKIFAVLGLIIIIMIAIYGALAAIRSIPNVWQAIGNAFSSVTSVFDGGDDLDLKARPQSPVSGEVTTISWTGRGLTNGYFSFAYECVEGVNFEIVNDDGRAFTFCNTPARIETDDNSIKISATLLNEDIVTVPIHITFTRDGEDDATASGEMKLTIIKASGDENPDTNGNNNGGAPTNKPTPSNGGNNGGSNGGTNNPQNGSPVLIPGNNNNPLTGYSDLSVRIIDTGTVNRASGLYTPTTYIKSTDTVAVRFEVANQGTNISGPWRFNATLPTNPGTIYPSMPQQSLRPGDRIQYTIGFDNIKSQSVNQLILNIDPDNTVRESDETNNALVHNIVLSQYSDSPSIPGYPNCQKNSDNVSYTCRNGSVVYKQCYLGTNGYTCYNNSIDDNNVDSDRERARRAINDAKDAIEEAQDEIDEAYDDGENTNDAEELLEDAEDKLEDAEDEYDDRDYDNAEELAEEAEDLANEAIDE